MICECVRCESVLCAVEGLCVNVCDERVGEREREREGGGGGHSKALIKTESGMEYE